jgi:hypothetical protein
MNDEEDSIELRFAQTFEGYTDSFVKHVPPFTVDEKSGKLKAKWVGIAEYRKNSSLHPSPPAGVEDESRVPVTLSKYLEHLQGGHGLAISPLFDLNTQEKGKNVVRKNVCNFGIIDVDVYGIDYFKIVNRLYSFGYKFSAFASKSGGLHIYFIFGKAESAKDVRAALNKIVELFGFHKIYSNAAGSRVEVFPQHDTRAPGVDDKYVFLPFYNALNDKENMAGKMYGAEGKMWGLKKAMLNMPKMFTSLKEITDATGKLPFADAPYCIQALLLSGVLEDGMHRNDFLFNTSLYMKLKYTEGFELKHLQEANEMLAEPKSEADLRAIYNSSMKEGYQLAGRCKEQPVCEVCDRSLCKLREFGVGKSRGNMVSTVEFGKIVRVKAEEPYYLWEARLAGTEEWKTLKINEADGLLEQRHAQVACIKVLNTIPPTVTKQVWEAEVIRCLSMIEEREAPKATDTTEMAELRNLFNRFLTHRKMKNNLPHTVLVKQVYYQEESKKFFFMTDGFQGFLRSQAFRGGRINLREELLRFGCKDDALKYVTPGGEDRVIECWSKEEDDRTKQLGTYYDDVTESDTITIMNNKLNKEQKKDDKPVDDDRF